MRQYLCDNSNRAPAAPAYGTGTDFGAQLLAAQKSSEVVVSQTAREVQAAFDKQRLDGIRAASSAADTALNAIQAKFAAMANAVTTALDDARNKAKGLFDLGRGWGAGIVTEPGKGGPFEALYRITDVAATMAGRAPGADTAQWQQMYGGIDYTGIAKNFQQGNLMAPGVFENIDWAMLGQQATQQEQSSKISTYAGQAVANLTQAGKPLTAENIKSAIDEMAAKDKAGIVPELQNVSKNVLDTGTVAHDDSGAQLEALQEIAGKLPGAAAPTPPGKDTTVVPPKTGGLAGKGYAAGTSFALAGMALVGERGPELVNLPQGAQVFTASQTDSILAGLALRGFASGTTYAPAGMAILGERGPELVQIPTNRQAGTARSGSSEPQIAAQFMTELARAINAKASTTQQAADTLADMLVNAAAANVQTNMLRQLARR